MGEFFNKTLAQMGANISGGFPVNSVHVNHEKNYAFVDVLLPHGGQFHDF
jgi:hypothetical protein